MASINVLLTLIIKKYLISHSWTNCILHISPNDTARFVKTVDNTSSYVISSTDNFAKLSESCEGILIWAEVEESMERLDAALRHAPNLILNYRNRRIIALGESQILHKLHQIKSLHYLADFLFVTCANGNDLYNNCTIYELYTHKFVGVDRNEEIIALDQFNVSNKLFSKNVNLFPDKFTKQDGRLLRIGVLEFFPLVDLKHKKGRVVQTAIEYAKKYDNNFFINNCNYSRIDDIPKSEIHTTLLSKLSQDEIDLIAGVMYRNPTRQNVFDIGYIISQQDISLLVPKPTQINSWTIFTKEFTTTAWILLISGLVIQMLIVFTIQRYQHLSLIDDRKLEVMLILGITLQQGLPRSREPRSLVLRTIIWLLFIQSVLYVTMWSSLLSVNLINPVYQDDIKTTEAYAKSKYPWSSVAGQVYGLPLVWDPRPQSQILYHKYKNYTSVQMQQALEDGHLATIIAKTPDYLSLDPYINLKSIVKYQPLHELLFRIFTIPYFRRNSILLDSYALFQMITWDTGLVDIWTRQAVYSDMISPMQLYLKFGVNEPNDFIQLNFSNFLSAFVILAFGLTIALVIFLGELITYNK